MATSYEFNIGTQAAMLHPRLVRNRSWPVCQTVSISVWISWPDRRFLLFRVPSEFFNTLPVKPFCFDHFYQVKNIAVVVLRRVLIMNALMMTLWMMMV